MALIDELRKKEQEARKAFDIADVKIPKFGRPRTPEFDIIYQEQGLARDVLGEAHKAVIKEQNRLAAQQPRQPSGGVTLPTGEKISAAQFKTQQPANVAVPKQTAPVLQPNIGIPGISKVGQAPLPAQAGIDPATGKPRVDFKAAITKQPEQFVGRQGQAIDPTKFTNLQPGTQDFENFLKEQGITRQAPTTQQQPTGQQILNEADLAEKRKELGAAGIPKSEWGKYISSPDAQGRLFFNKPATLTSPTGEKKVVAVGSQEASQLLSQDYILGDKKKDGITPEALEEPVTDIDVTVGSGTTDVVGDTGATSSTTQVVADIESKLKLIQDTKTEAQTEEDVLANLEKELFGELEGRSALETQLRQEKVATLEADLTSINNQIQAKEAEKIRLLTEERGKPITLQSIIGVQAQIRAVLNSDIFTLTAQANALMNNISLAERQIQNAVDAKYGPILERISIAQAQRDTIANIVSRDERVQLDALNAQDIERRQTIEDQKQEDLNIQKTMLQAISAGITDNNIISQISNAGSFNEAIQILGENMPGVADESVANLQSRYPDAGIVGTDTFAEASVKLPNSRIYQQQTRLVGGRGGGAVDISTGGAVTQERIDSGIIPTVTGKPRTDAQNLSLGFAQRMENANTVIDEIGGQFTGFGSIFAGNKFFPNILKSDDRQRFEQAQRNFINAVLRKESGAAISPSEFDSAAIQYFPQPGDGEAVLVQKTSNRRQAINNIILSSNTEIGFISSNINLEQQVKNVGFDYQAMKAAGHSDEEIKQALNIQ